MFADIMGYAGKILRVDLGRRKIKPEALDAAVLRKWVGGTGLAAKYLYDEVPPGVEWNDPGNRLIFASGPLGGTRVGGSGTISIVTRGAMTGGAASSQANGFMGAYLKLSGFDGIIIHGRSEGWVYLYIHDGGAELRDAAHLLGRDTWETGQEILRELGREKKDASIFSIGPAGESLVRFAAIAGDEGHVSAHNGVGAVMGSKRLKAVVVERGRKAFPLHDGEKLGRMAKELLARVRSNASGEAMFKWGTSTLFTTAQAIGILPVKNYTTNLFPDHARWMGDSYRPKMERKRNPCWACQFDHCSIVKVKDGPFAGYEGEEPEYEQWAAFGPVIGQDDLGTAVMLSNEVDRLGMDANESGWLIAMLMECYEKGIINKKDTDGLEMTWGDGIAARDMLRRVARREGIGDVLAEGVMRAAQELGDEAVKCGVYTMKGNTPRGHDHRGNWPMLIDTCLSQIGTDQAPATPAGGIAALGLPADTSPATPEGAVAIHTRREGLSPFEDTLGVCRFNIYGLDLDGWAFLAEVINAATGWDFTREEEQVVGLRIVNLLRAFNMRHGHTAELDRPSPRYGSAPVDGPAKGREVAASWDRIREDYYEQMGWDRRTGKPLPETLKKLGLGYIIAGVWD